MIEIKKSETTRTCDHDNVFLSAYNNFPSFLAKKLKKLARNKIHEEGLKNKQQPVKLN